MGLDQNVLALQILGSKFGKTDLNRYLVLNNRSDITPDVI